MSDGKLTITIDGEEAKAHAAFMSLTKDQKDLVAEIGKMGIAAEAAADKSIQAAKNEGKERQIQIRLAEQLVKSNETLNQAYERQKAALDAALQAGSITADQHRQTLEALGKKVQENSAEFIEAKQREQDALNEAIEVERKNAKEVEAAKQKQISLAESLVKKSETITQAYERQRAALDAALKAGVITAEEHAQAIEHIGVANEEAFGSSAVQKVGAFAAKFATIAAAVEIVRKALQFYNSEKEKAMGSTETLTDVRRQMRQLSNGDFDQMSARAENLTQFGLTRVQSHQLVADARAMGFEGKEDLVAKIQPVISLPESTVLAGTFREFFKDERLDIEQSFNMALQGAESHPLGIKEMIPQLAVAATGRIEGGESSDIVASVAEMAKVAGLSAGERIRNLGVELATNEKTSGLNMIDAMRLVQSDQKLRQEITGGNSVMQATVASYIKMIDEIEKTDKKVEQAVRNSGTDKSLIRLKADEAVDPNTKSGQIEKARQESTGAQARTEMLNEMANAEVAFQAKSAVEKVNATEIERGSNVFQRMAASAAATSASTLGASEETIESSGAWGRNLLRPLGNIVADWMENRYRAAEEQANEEIKKQTSAIDKQTSAIERQTSAIERMNQFIGV